MSEIITPLVPEYTMNVPNQALALIGWGLWLLVLIILVVRDKEQPFKLNRKNLLWLALLSLAILLFTPFFGISIENQNPGISGGRPFSHLMFLAALPWMLAGGILGLFPSMLLAAVSGFYMAYLDTHHFFTPLLFMSAAYIYHRLIRQSETSRFIKIFRLPLFASVVSLLISMPLIFLSQLFSITGTFEQRIIFALAGYQPTVIAFGGMLLVAGVTCTLIKILFPKLWLDNATLKQTPAKHSFRAHWSAFFIPFLTLLWIGVTVLSWKSVESKERKAVVNQLTTTSNLVAEDLSGFVNMGQDLLAQKVELSQGSFYTQPGFAETFRGDSAFTEIFDRVLLIDFEGKIIASYPRVAKQNIGQLEEKTSLITRVSGEDLDNGYVTGVETGNSSNRIVLLTEINQTDAPGEFILWGEINSLSTQLMRSSLGLLELFAENGAIGEIITIDGINLYHTQLAGSIPNLSTVFYSTPTFIDNIVVDGQPFMQYFCPITGTDLAVVVSYPINELYISVLRAIYPILWGGLIILLFSILLNIVGWSIIEKTLNQLHSAMERITAGDLDFSIKRSKHKTKFLPINEDLSVMVDAIKERTRQQNQIFSISKVTAGSLDVENALNILMKAALSHGVSSVRIIVSYGSDGTKSSQIGRTFSMGKHAHDFEPLDEEILTSVLNQGILVYRDFQIGKEINLPKGMPYPASLIAVPLNSQGKNIGALWITFQDLRSPNNGDVEFFKEIASRASALIKNNRIFTEATRARSQLEAILDVLPDAVFLFDPEENIIYQNHEAVKLFQGQTINSMDDIENQFRGCGISTLFEPGSEPFSTHEVDLHNGTAFHVVCNRIDFDGASQGKILVFSNITEEKAKDSRKSEYVATVSHELRTPLTLIQGYAKILRLTGNLNEQQNDYLNNIIQGVEEMQHLVQNLLDIGRLESGAPLEVSSFYAIDVMRKVKETAAIQAKQNNINLRMLEPEEVIAVEADITLVTQALKNLVDNGIKFTKMGGEVTLSVSALEKDIIFAVKDTGMGISPLDQHHLFDKFHKITPNAGEKQSGSGLGLAIVKFIAERHGGKVWVESQLGQGSTFYFQIPQGVEQQ
jgi:signal transduction histidine kinase